METHYLPKKNQTIVMTTPVDLDDNNDGDDVDLRPTREKVSGIHMISLTIKQRQVTIKY